MSFRIVVDDQGLADLERDLRALPRQASAMVRKAVRHGTMTGNLLAKEHARAKSGPHGKAFHKRFTYDQPVPSMFGGIGWSGEYGPAGVPRSEFVGAGYRHGGINRDLEVSQDPAAGVVAQDIRAGLNDLFWRGRQ